MNETPITPPRQRMIEDMTVRKLGAALGVAYGAGLRVTSPTTRDKKRQL